MNFAKCLMKNGTWISKLYVSDILDGRVSENDILEAYCPCCSKQAYFVHSDIRILHLASRHSPSCDFVNDGRIHKKIIKVIDKKLDVFSLLNYIDGPVRGRGGGENGGGEDPGEDGPDESGPINTIDDIDTIEVETIASVNTVRGLVLSYKEYGGEKECGGGFRLKDIIATQSTFFGYRKKGIRHQ